MRITLLFLLLSTLAACAQSSGGGDGKNAKTDFPDYGPMSAEDISVSNRLKAHAWCMRYTEAVNETSKDILVEERHEFLTNDQLRITHFEMRDEQRARKIEEGSAKWKVVGDSLYVKVPEGTIVIAKLKFLESGELNLVWEEGDRGMTYKTCL